MEVEERIDALPPMSEAEKLWAKFRYDSHRWDVYHLKPARLYLGRHEYGIIVRDMTENPRAGCVVEIIEVARERYFRVEFEYFSHLQALREQRKWQLVKLENEARSLQYLDKKIETLESGGEEMLDADGRVRHWS